jgi:16S rRNA (uracil1498-N3)-methyltransferase
VSAPVFWAPQGLLVPLSAGDSIRLDGPEGHHAATVRRLRVGEALIITDGLGCSADCLVASVARDSLTATVGTVATVIRPEPRVVVVQAVPKGDRGETAVETLTEVGVDVIVPWAAARCVAQWTGDRGARALAKWRATAREGAKQSRRSWWPEVAPLATTEEVVALLAAAGAGVVLHEAAAHPLATVAVPTSGDVVVVVGPEGGLDGAELERFAAAGAVTVRMGPTVLRTSTAGTVAAAVLLAASPRWR